MGVYPKSELLNISMVCCSLVGIFPWEFMFENNKMLKKVYRALSNIILTFFVIFVLTELIQLYFLISGPIIRTDEISKNVCITIPYVLAVIRQLIIKNRPGFLKLIEYIIEVENKKSVIEDEETRKIDNEALKKCQKIIKIYIALTVVLTIQYLSIPLNMNDEVISEYGNVTRIIKYLPLSSWFPFDDQNYYNIAYMCQVINCLIGGSYATYTDILMCNLIIFPTAELKKLQHYFRNLEKFKLKVKEIYKISNDDKAGQITCVHFIGIHRKLIRYVDNFNETMGTIMVFDFIQSSIQIASIVTQSTTDEFKSVLAIVIALSVALLFVLRQIIRLYFYYYFANDIIVSSEQISSAIWESNWYEQSPRTKFFLLMIMIRCAKPLSFNIGPFNVMSIQSFISILKAAYSYAMLTIK